MNFVCFIISQYVASSNLIWQVKEESNDKNEETTSSFYSSLFSSQVCSDDSSDSGRPAKVSNMNINDGRGICIFFKFFFKSVANLGF